MRIHISRVRSGPQLDMTPDGQFVGPRPPTAVEKLLRYAIIVAVIAGLAALAALALWLALVLIPIALAAALVAYAVFRWRVWRMSRAAHGRSGPPYAG
jgi:predicted lysophospholipase L1 biosynthesis ABC-type transport system permease subunit